MRKKLVVIVALILIVVSMTVALSACVYTKEHTYATDLDKLQEKFGEYYFFDIDKEQFEFKQCGYVTFNNQDMWGNEVEVEIEQWNMVYHPYGITDYEIIPDSFLDKITQIRVTCEIRFSSRHDFVGDTIEEYVNANHDIYVTRLFDGDIDDVRCMILKHGWLHSDRAKSATAIVALFWIDKIMYEIEFQASLADETHIETMVFAQATPIVESAIYSRYKGKDRKTN